ncbi:MAG: hypothetical protein Kow00124_24380 [Anaerolineae bacterium]
MADRASQEGKIQQLANILSLVAIVGGMDNAAVQRVLVSLGSALVGSHSGPLVDRDLAQKLLAQVVTQSGEQAALNVLSDLSFVAAAWQPVLDEFAPLDPHRPMPYAEIIDLLVNYSGAVLQRHDAFQLFGGADYTLPLDQLSAALSTYPVPQPGLKWELIGFPDSPDFALVAGDARTLFLFKTHAASHTLRFSELEPGSDAPARSEQDVAVDSGLFAAFLAGLLGEMLYWAARLRRHAAPGQEMWRRLQALLVSGTWPPAAAPAAAPPPVDDAQP